jgi:hypothetical protein
MIIYDSLIQVRQQEDHAIVGMNIRQQWRAWPPLLAALQQQIAGTNHYETSHARLDRLNQKVCGCKKLGIGDVYFIIIKVARGDAVPRGPDFCPY